MVNLRKFLKASLKKPENPGSSPRKSREVPLPLRRNFFTLEAHRGGLSFGVDISIVPRIESSI